MDAARLFIVRTEYALPEYQLRAPGGTFPGFLHPSGVRVQLGHAPNGSPACGAESDRGHARDLGLLRRESQETLNDIDLAMLRRFSRQVREQHRSAADDVVRAVRWISRRDQGGAAIGERTKAAWSEDGSSWHRLPIGDPPLTDTGWGVFDLDKSRRDFIAGAITAGATEPLAHEMLHEARSTLDSNPRSCLVIAVAALEVGVKQHIKRMGGSYVERGPGADTVQKLLNNDVPALRPDRWRDLTPWLNVRLQKGNTSRNKLVHAGKPPPEREEMRLLIRGIRDVLYLMDWQYGHEWALTYVSFLAGDLDMTGPEPAFKIVVPLV